MATKFTLKPFREALAMTKQAIEEALIPIRVAQAKKQGEMEQLKIDEQILNLEGKLQEATVSNPINYDKVINYIDEIELLNRRKEQFDKIIEELFAEPTKTKK